MVVVGDVESQEQKRGSRKHLRLTQEPTILRYEAPPLTTYIYRRVHMGMAYTHVTHNMDNERQTERACVQRTDMTHTQRIYY